MLFRSYKQWYDVLGVENLQKQCILNMLSTALRRIMCQQSNFTKISGAHDRANVVIANWLLECGSVKLNSKVVNYNDKDYTIYEFEVVNLNDAINKITELVELVQEIKSTSNYQKCLELFETYTINPISIEEANRIRTNLLNIRNIVNDGVEAYAFLFPKLDGTYDTFSDIFEQNIAFNS